MPDPSRMILRAAPLLVVFLALWGALWGATAAGAQYTVLGGSAPTGIPDKESLWQNVDDARWTAGPFRFQPWIGLRDASFVAQQQDAEGGEIEDQFTLTAGAGLRAYAPLGPKVLFAAHVLPEYVWWQDDDSKNGVNGRYGAGLFAHGNRLELELSHRLEERQDLFSREVQELTSTATETTRLGVEVRLFRNLWAYGGYGLRAFEGEEDEEEIFTLLDRDEEERSAGLRLRSPRGWSVGLGVAEGEVEFDPGARAFSLEYDSVVLNLSADVGKLSASLQAEEQSADPVEGSELPAFEETLGRASLGWRPRDRFGSEIYGERRRTFSVRESNSLIFVDEVGLRLFVGLGPMQLELLAAEGENEFEGLGGSIARSEDVTTFGGTLAVPVGGWGSMTLNLIERSYDAGSPELDRDVTSFGLGIRLGDLADRLSIGEGQSSW